MMNPWSSASGAASKNPTTTPVLLRALGPDSVGSVVDVTIRRGGEPVRIKLTIGERADA